MQRLCSPPQRALRCHSRRCRCGLHWMLQGTEPSPHQTAPAATLQVQRVPAQRSRSSCQAASPGYLSM